MKSLKPVKVLFVFALIQFTMLVACISPGAEKEFVKDYKLLKLDGDSCESCIIRVKEGHVYDILKKGLKVGTGKWKLVAPWDYPGYVLELENGPRHMIYSSDTTIQFINRNRK